MPRSSNKSKKGSSLIAAILLLGVWLYPPTLGTASNLPSVAMPLIDMKIPVSIDTNKIETLMDQLESERRKLLENKAILERQQDSIKYNL